MASETLFDLRSHISDLRLSTLCLCGSAPLHLTKLSSFVIVFMQNKANFRKSQVNVTSLIIMNYEEKSNWTLGENKPNSNPNKANFQKAQMSVNSLITKDYRKKDDFAVQKNKANSNPISVKPKMSANSLLAKDYENETAFGLRENKPNQSQSQKQKSENRKQKTEGRSRKTEDRNQKTEGRVQSSVLRHPPSALCCDRQREDKICIGKEL